MKPRRYLAREDVRMEWSVDHASPVPQLREADVEDLDELERALEQMAETATNGPPLVVELVGPTGGRLGIGLGPLGQRALVQSLG
jgi:hypothetical protein